MNNLSDAQLKKMLEKYIERNSNEKKLLQINEELKSREEFRKRLNQNKFKIQRIV